MDTAPASKHAEKTFILHRVENEQQVQKAKEISQETKKVQLLKKRNSTRLNESRSVTEETQGHKRSSFFLPRLEKSSERSNTTIHPSSPALRLTGVILNQSGCHWGRGKVTPNGFRAGTKSMAACQTASCWNERELGPRRNSRRHLSVQNVGQGVSSAAVRTLG